MASSTEYLEDLRVTLRSSPDAEGALCLDGDRIGRLTRLRPMEIVVAARSHPDRRRIEAFIEDVYQRSHGATITEHYPTLIGLNAADGSVIGALGLRSAAADPLFLEQYLRRPVEEAIRRATGEDAQRTEIVEIGSLASAGSGASVFLIIAATALLDSQRFRYAVVTATASLRRLFGGLGFAHTVLGAARRELLADGGRNWGSYYASRPQMLAGAIAPALALVNQYLPFEHNGDLAQLLAAVSGQI